MNAPTWKALARLALVMAVTYQSSLQAQTTLTLPTSGTSGSVNFQLRLDGSIVEEGSGSSTLSNADLESSSRFIWYPVQSAFRAGGGLSTETVGQVGQYSAAFGLNTIASGIYSMAFGNGSVANYYGATAFGLNSTASNYVATAMGRATTASGDSSLSSGCSTAASGFASVAFGQYTFADGSNSVSIGGQNWAEGNMSLVGGFNSVAWGDFSMALGYSVSAGSYDSVAFGSYNVTRSEGGGGTSRTTWVAIDPLFEIGNGTGSGSTPYSDAFVVYKDGNAAIQGNLSAGGVITAQPGGDIPMYSGN